MTMTTNPDGIERVLRDFDESRDIANRIEANKQRRCETLGRAKVAMGIINAVRFPNGPKLDYSATDYSELVVTGRDVRDDRHVLSVASLETQWYDTMRGGLVREIKLIPGSAVLVSPQQIEHLESDRYADRRIRKTIGGLVCYTTMDYQAMLNSERSLGMLDAGSLRRPEHMSESKGYGELQKIDEMLDQLVAATLDPDLNPMPGNAWRM